MIRMHGSFRWVPPTPKSWVLSTPYAFMIPGLVALTGALFIMVVHISAFHLGHLSIEVPSPSSPGGTALITFPWAPISLCANQPPEQFIFLFSQLALAVGILVYIQRVREAFVEGCCSCLALENSSSIRIVQPVLVPATLIEKGNASGGFQNDSGDLAQPQVVYGGGLTERMPSPAISGRGAEEPSLAHPTTEGSAAGEACDGDSLQKLHEARSTTPVGGDSSDVAYHADHQQARNFSLSASHDAVPPKDLQLGSATENPPPAPPPIRAVWAPYFDKHPRPKNRSLGPVDQEGSRRPADRHAIRERVDEGQLNLAMIAEQNGGNSGGPNIEVPTDPPVLYAPVQAREIGLLKKRRPLLGLTTFCLYLGLLGMVFQAIVPVEKGGLQQLGKNCRLVKDAAVGRMLPKTTVHWGADKVEGTEPLVLVNAPVAGEESTAEMSANEPHDVIRSGLTSNSTADGAPGRMARQEGKRGSTTYRSGSGLPIVPVATPPPREDLIDVPGEFMEGQVGMPTGVHSEDDSKAPNSNQEDDDAIEFALGAGMIPAGTPTDRYLSTSETSTDGHPKERVEDQPSTPEPPAARVLLAEFLGDLPLLKEGTRGPLGENRFRGSFKSPRFSSANATSLGSPQNAIFKAKSLPPPSWLSGGKPALRWLGAENPSFSDKEAEVSTEAGSKHEGASVHEYFSTPDLRKVADDAFSWIKKATHAISEYSMAIAVVGEAGKFRGLQGGSDPRGSPEYLARADDVVYCPSMPDFSGDYWTLVHACASLLFFLGCMGAEVCLLVWLIVHRLRYTFIHWCQRSTGLPKQGPQIRRLFKPGWYSIGLKIVILVFMFLSPISWAKRRILTKYSSIDLVGISQRFTVGCILLFVASLGFEIRTMKRTMLMV